jgi:hypothetical protein
LYNEAAGIWTQADIKAQAAERRTKPSLKSESYSHAAFENSEWQARAKQQYSTSTSTKNFSASGPNDMTPRVLSSHQASSRGVWLSLLKFSSGHIKRLTFK